MPARLIGYFRRGPAVGDGGPAPGAAAVFGTWQRWLLLVGFALLVMLRLPAAWVEGRFLDEEATVFLAYAWHRPWQDALFRSFAGYMNFAANATTVAVAALVKGGVVPLERAPYLTMVTALTVQMLPAALLLTGHARWLSGRLAVIAALLIAATAPGTEEVFFNVLHIQFHLALCAALILALEVPRRRSVQIGYGAVLIGAPLCGPGAIVILPLFALRAVVDRDRGRLWQFAAFAAGAAVQLLVFYGPSPIRGHLFDPGSIAAAMFVRMIALPAGGVDLARGIGVTIIRSHAAGGTGWSWAVAVAVVLLGTLTVAAARRRDSAIWLTLAALVLAAATFGFGGIIVDHANLFNVIAGERYNFLPMVLIGWALVAMAMRAESPVRLVYGALCLVVLVTGLIGYPKTMRALRGGPSWHAEVAKWRRDHRYPLRVWSALQSADLSDESRRCTPVGRDPIRSTDPHYCESGWVADIYRAQSRRQRSW